VRPWSLPARVFRTRSVTARTVRVAEHGDASDVDVDVTGNSHSRDEVASVETVRTSAKVENQSSFNLALLKLGHSFVHLVKSTRLVHDAGASIGVKLEGLCKVDARTNE